MAVEDLNLAADRRYEDLRGRVFEYLLAAATLFGIVALGALVAVVSWDAIEPTTADPGWYLVYLATLVAPGAAFWRYARRRPAVAAVSKRILSVLVVGGALGLVALAVLSALAPTDVAVYALAAGAPTLAVAAYGRRNPAATWTGPGVPVAALAGLAVGWLLFDPIHAFVYYWADWVSFAGLVAAPAAALLGYRVADRYGARVGVATGASTLGGAAVVALAGFPLGYDPPLGAVLVPTVVAPGAYVAADVLLRREGRAGLLAPVVLVGGVLVGVAVTNALGLAAPDAWLSETLLMDSFSTLSPRDAGVYPQIVGSIVLVSVMALLVFPVGVGAAVYLEEYAPQSGPMGRVTRLLQVNIANLAGVPSVVYGLLGIGLFLNLLAMQRGLLIAGAATLGLLILPIVIVSAQEAIRSVPDSHRQAAYGMGASRWQAVRDVVLPQAMPGILTGTILALGRAIGETAPILLVGVATTKLSPPGGLFEKATALPLQVFASRALPQEEYRYGVLAAAVIVLLGLLLAMNAAAIVLRNRYQRED